MKYTAFDSYGDELGSAYDMDAAEIVNGHTLREAARINDGYIEDDDGIIVYDSQDDYL